jgi:hypothetical protein
LVETELIKNKKAHLLGEPEMRFPFRTINAQPPALRLRDDDGCERVPAWYAVTKLGG